MKESDFQRAVLDLARLRQWLPYYTWASMHSPSGFPDLTLVRGERIVFAELKVKAKVTEWQRMWLSTLARTGKCQVFLWTPDCWPQIERVLDIL